MATFFIDATWGQKFVFALFLLLWISYGLLNELAKRKGITFNATTVVWVQEFLKLALSIILFRIQDGPWKSMLLVARKQKLLVCWYLIPAGLYALNDVLIYVNIRSFDPPTYFLLSEMKIVLTAVVHQSLLRRRLRAIHWMALVIITLGCIVKATDQPLTEVGEGDSSSAPAKSPGLLNYLLLLLQISASTIAGVYNEKILKDRADIPVNLQNCFLYTDSILLLTVSLVFHPKAHPKAALAPSNLRSLLRQPEVLAMVCIMSTVGVVTGRFLKVFDSVRKSIAAALIVVVMPFLSALCFQKAVTVKMFVAVACVVFGMFLYTLQGPPVAVVSSSSNVLVAADEVMGDTEFLLEESRKEEEESKATIELGAVQSETEGGEELGNLEQVEGAAIRQSVQR